MTRPSAQTTCLPSTTMNRRPPRTHGDTRLDRFLTARRIARVRFAKATGYSKQQVQRVRFGDAEPTAKAISGFVKAARLLTNDPKSSWGNQYSLVRENNPKVLNSLQLIVPDAKAAAAGTHNFFLNVAFGRITARVAEYKV